MCVDYMQISHFPQALGYLWSWAFAGCCGIPEFVLDTKGELFPEYFKNSCTEIKGKELHIKESTSLKKRLTKGGIQTDSTRMFINLREQRAREQSPNCKVAAQGSRLKYGL